MLGKVKSLLTCAIAAQQHYWSSRYDTAGIYPVLAVYADVCGVLCISSFLPPRTICQVLRRVCRDVHGWWHLKASWYVPHTRASQTAIGSWPSNVMWFHQSGLCMACSRYNAGVLFTAVKGQGLTSAAQLLLGGAANAVGEWFLPASISFLMLSCFS